jgi:Flp pilus assembly protein TadD
MGPYNFVAFLVVTFSVALPCFGQTTQPLPSLSRAGYSVRGKVHDESDEIGIDNIRVRLESAGIVLDVIYTSEGGIFEFDGVASGDYVLEVQVDGYYTFSAPITVNGGPVSGFSVALEKSRSVSRSNSAPAATVSARELAIPRSAHEAFEKGYEMLNAKVDFPGAIAQFQTAIQNFPAYYEAYTMEGVAYISLADPADAETVLRKSIDLSAGRYPEALFFLASVLNNMKRFPEAEAAARSALALQESSWPANYELARALYALKSVGEAETAALRAHALNPGNSDVVLLLADIHLRQGNLSAVLQDIDSYLKLDPTGPRADAVRRDHDQIVRVIQKTSGQSATNRVP